MASFLSFEDVERLRCVLVCALPHDDFPFASYLGAVRQMGGSTEAAEGILEHFAPLLARPLSRLPATNPQLFWSSQRLFAERKSVETSLPEQIWGLIVAEGGAWSQDPRVVRAKVSDALRRIYSWAVPCSWVYFDGLQVRRIQMPEKGVPRYRDFGFCTEANIKQVLKVLEHAPLPMEYAAADW